MNIIITLNNIVSKMRIHKRCNLFCTQCLSLVIDGEMEDNVFKECVKKLEGNGLTRFFQSTRIYFDIGCRANHCSDKLLNTFLAYSRKIKEFSFVT